MFFGAYDDHLKNLEAQRKELEEMTLEIGKQIHQNVFGFSQEWNTLAKNAQTGFQEAFQHCNSFLLPGMMAEFFMENTRKPDQSTPE